MDPATGAAAISAAASIGGSILGGSSKKKAAKKAFKRTVQLAQMQRNWELENYKNAHQWEMEDLKKAGINPAMTAEDGTNIGTSGAGNLSFPFGADTNFGNLAQDIMSGIATATQFETAKAQQKEMEANASKATAEALETAEKTKFISPKAKQEIKESNTRIAVNTAQTEEIKQQKELAAEETTNQAIKNIIDKAEADFKTGNFAKAMRYINEFSSTVGNVGKNIFLPLAGAKTAKDALNAIREIKNSNIYKLLEKTPTRKPSRYR